MKRYLKIISSVLCLLIVVTVMPFSAFAAEGGKSGIFTYEFEYGKLAITACDIPENGVVVIPSTIGNNFVKRIGVGVFKNSAVKNVYIPEGVEVIDTESFYACTSLERISIPSSVEFIEGSAFWNCSNIELVCYSGSSTSWNEIQIGDFNDYLKNAKRSYHSHESAATQTVGYVAPECITEGYTGDKYFTECGVIAEIGTVIEATDHTSSGWKIVEEPTLEKEGKKEERCAECSALLNEEVIPMLIGIKDITVDKSAAEILNGASLQLTATVYPDDASNVSIKWTTDNSAVASVNSNGLVTAKGLGKAVITATATGENGSFSASCNITVLPREFNVTWVTENGTLTECVKEGSELVKPENPEKSGYTFVGWEPEVPDAMPSNDMTFTAKFILIANPGTTLEIRKTKTEKINYGDILILHADVEEVPEAAKIEWSVEGTGVTVEPSEDGSECRVTSTGNGDVVVKAKLVDENGEDIIDAEGNSIYATKKLTSKAGFFQKLISFFKNLFGSDRVVEG